MKRSNAPYHFLSEENVDLNGSFQVDTVDDRKIWKVITSEFIADGRQQVPKSSIWAVIEQKWHGEFVDALYASDIETLSNISASLHAQPLLKGIDQSAGEHRKYTSDSNARERFLLNIKSHLVRLAEAIGVLPIELGPRYREPENIYLDVGDLVARISDFLGIDIAPPCIGNKRFGLTVGRGVVITNRDLYAIYLAWRAFSLTKQRGIDVSKARLIEIGGGMGRLALFAHRFGFRNITLLDLPQISAIQAYFLSRALDGGINLWPSSSSFKAEGINIVTGNKFLNEVDDDCFDIAINSDSMPEMGWVIANDYIAQIERTCSGVFLSANQEARKPIGDKGNTHSVVSEIIQKRSSFKRLYRFPFWMRSGYVEELFEIQP